MHSYLLLSNKQSDFTDNLAPTLPNPNQQTISAIDCIISSFL